MAEFLSDFVFIVELFAIASGLVLLDKAQAGGRGHLKAAGWLLVVGGIGTALCTGYYWFKYNGQGDFDRAYPAVMMQDMQGTGMQGGMVGQEDCPKGTRAEDCPRAGIMMNDDQMPMGPGGSMQQRQRMMQDGDSQRE